MMRNITLKILTIISLSCFLFLSSPLNVWSQTNAEIFQNTEGFNGVYIQYTGTPIGQLSVSFSNDNENWGEVYPVHFDEEVAGGEHSREGSIQAESDIPHKILSQLFYFDNEYKYLRISSPDPFERSKIDLLYSQSDSQGNGFGIQSSDDNYFWYGDIKVVSRKGWGCPDYDSSSDYYCDGPFWGTSYNPTTHVTVHHTATTGSTSDWASVVRAIWQNHSHVRDADPDDGVQGWTDIGYHYLVAPDGTVYEGRYGQRYATNDETVTGGHALERNTGNVGIAVIGDYSNSNISALAKTSLETLIQSVLDDKNLKSRDVTTHSSGQTRQVISGHRDWEHNATACPGNALYADLINLHFSNVGTDELKPVYRFLHKDLKIHFYTANTKEKNYVRNILGSDWKYEGVSYRSSRVTGGTTTPVYRYLHKQLKIHFYTSNEGERNILETKLKDVWQFDGRSFYAFSSDESDAKPVYRFLHKQMKIHFYTANEGERDLVLDKLSDNWKYEGIAYYTK